MTMPPEPDATAFKRIALAALGKGFSLGLPRWDTRERLLEAFDRIADRFDAFEQKQSETMSAAPNEPEGDAAMDDRNRRVGIGALYVDVHEFHRVFNHPARLTPGLQPADRVTARADWIDEEVGELRDAKNIYDQADAYIDIIYFAVGGLVEMGVDPSELWRIVHGANMAKVFSDGTVKRREDGKIMKPPHWRAPDEAIYEEINRQIGLHHKAK